LRDYLFLKGSSKMILPSKYFNCAALNSSEKSLLQSVKLYIKKVGKDLNLLLLKLTLIFLMSPISNMMN